VLFIAGMSDLLPVRVEPEEGAKEENAEEKVEETGEEEQPGEENNEIDEENKEVSEENKEVSEENKMDENGEEAKDEETVRANTPP
jgi:hypothetical protein